MEVLHFDTVKFLIIGFIYLSKFLWNILQMFCSKETNDKLVSKVVRPCSCHLVRSDKCKWGSLDHYPVTHHNWDMLKNVKRNTKVILEVCESLIDEH